MLQYTIQQVHNVKLVLLVYQKLHMDNSTWDDIGYNFLIADNGEIFQGRGWNYTVAHCKGFNAQSIGTNIF
jgi:N-acetylmuramoyl-L-alanine amidase